MVGEYWAVWREVREFRMVRLVFGLSWRESVEAVVVCGSRIVDTAVGGGRVSSASIGVFLLLEVRGRFVVRTLCVSRT